MALFEYFPQNYIWNLSLAIALASGAEIGELMDMCKPLKDTVGTHDSLVILHRATKLRILLESSILVIRISRTDRHALLKRSLKARL